jgi:uncharacterized protein
MLWLPTGRTPMIVSGRFTPLLLLPLLIACAGDQPPASAPAAASPPSAAELARSGYEAFGRGDIDAVLSLMAPDVVWHEAESLPYGGVWRGPDAVLENIFSAIGRDWDEYAAEPRQFIETDDHVVVLGEYRGVYRANGARMQAPFAHVWQFREGRLVTFHQFTDTALWLAAIAGGGRAPDSPLGE